jgi:hypothetical protein
MLSILTFHIIVLVIMSIIRVNADNTVAVADGTAYGAIAGGAASFIPDYLRWYTGVNWAGYIAMLSSNGLVAWQIASVIAVRGAIKEAARNHHEEIGPLCRQAEGENVHRLMLNPAEMMDDELMVELTQREKLTIADWIRGGDNAAAANVIIHLPTPLAASFRSPVIIAWARSSAQMAYTIIADNGYGLIVNSHHYRGQAEAAAISTLKMYGLDRVARDLGITVKDTASFIFHDLLHPLAYEAVTSLVNAPPAAFQSKVASTVLKRLPAYPGGSTHVQRGLTVRRNLAAHARIGPAIGVLWGSAPDLALDAVNGRIIANPLDFNAQFRPQNAARAKILLENVVPYCVTLFGLYDACYPPVRGQDANGPTRGPGIRKLIEENIALYQSAVDVAKAALERAGAPALDVYLQAVVEGYRAPANVPARRAGNADAPPGGEDEEEEIVPAGQGEGGAA